MGLAGDQETHSQLGSFAIPTVKPQASCLRPEESPTLLPISWLKYLSQHGQMFHLRKELNIILEKAMMLCCELCMARGIHFAPKCKELFLPALFSERSYHGRQKNISGPQGHSPPVSRTELKGFMWCFS